MPVIITVTTNNTTHMRKTLCILSALATSVAFADTADQVIKFGNADSLTGNVLVVNKTGVASFTQDFENEGVSISGSTGSGLFWATQTVSFSGVNTAAQAEWQTYTGQQISSVVSGLYPGGAGANFSLTIGDASFVAGEQFTMYVTVGAQAGGSVSLGSLTGLTDVTVSLAGAAASETAWVDVTASSGGSYALGSMTVTGTTGNFTYGATIVKVTGALTGDPVGMSFEDGHKAMVSSVAYSVTPEPTTATLSLLALAGLCARRRRK